MSCLDMMAEISKEHRTQLHDMGAVRTVKNIISKMLLRRVDPFVAA